MCFNIEWEIISQIHNIYFYASQLNVLATSTCPLSGCTQNYKKKIIYIKVMGKILALHLKAFLVKVDTSIVVFFPPGIGGCMPEWHLQF